MTTPTATQPTRPLSPVRPSARQRRVKHGIVAGYLHDLTQRHGAVVAPLAPATPRPA